MYETPHRDSHKCVQFLYRDRLALDATKTWQSQLSMLDSIFVIHCGCSLYYYRTGQPNCEPRQKPLYISDTVFPFEQFSESLFPPDFHKYTKIKTSLAPSPSEQHFSAQNTAKPCSPCLQTKTIRCLLHNQSLRLTRLKVWIPKLPNGGKRVDSTRRLFHPG